MSKKRKPDNARPSPFKGEFSFVNKDAGNINSKDHNSAVSWHVLNRYEKWKRAERNRRSGAPKLEPGSSRNTPNIDVTPTPPSDRHRDSDYRQRIGRLNPQSQVQSMNTQNFPSPPAWNIHDPKQPTVSPPVESSWPFEASTSSSVALLSTPTLQTELPMRDASLANAQAIGFDRDTDESLANWSPQQHPLFDFLISFASEFMISQAWPHEDDRLEHDFEKSKCFDEFVQLQHDSTYARALMASIATSMANVFQDDENLHIQARLFANAAMLRVRQQITQPNSSSDVQLLKAILELFCSETAIDNTSAARTHLKMLRKLVVENGGVIVLDSWFRENLISCDSYFALKYETRPLFPASEWTPGPLGQPWKARILLSGVSRNQLSTIHSTLDHQVLKGVVSDLRELFLVNHFIRIGGAAETSALPRWKQLRLFECVSCLADHHINLVLFPHLHLNPKLQALACTAIALITAMVMGTPEPVSMGLKLYRDLTIKFLGATAEAEEGGELESFSPQFKLWILYVGMLAEKVHPVPENEIWCEDLYFQQIETMGISNFEGVKPILRQFLYSELLNQEIEQGRAKRSVETRKGIFRSCSTSWRESIRSSSAETPEIQIAAHENEIIAKGKEMERQSSV